MSAQTTRSSNLTFRIGPGSFLEVLPILSQLTSSDHAPSFHVVAPSLPNFGFSPGLSKRGFALPQYAETLHKLMFSLGYSQHVTQAGDWGMWITRAIGKAYPESCRASHVNVPFTLPPTWTKHPMWKAWDSIMPLSQKEKERQERTNWFEKEAKGSFDVSIRIDGTKSRAKSEQGTMCSNPPNHKQLHML